MDNPESFVVFKHENEDFVLQNEQIVLNRYHREFPREKIVEFKTDSNHGHVKLFFQFLQTGEVPSGFEDQLHVFKLLKEWDCHFSVFDSYRIRIQTKSMNGFVSHQNKTYPVNVGCLFFQSPVFHDFFIRNPNKVFCIDSGCNPKSVQIFIDLIHFRIVQLELEYIDQVLELCCLLGCFLICPLINKESPESIIQKHSDYLGKKNQVETNTKNLKESETIPNGQLGKTGFSSKTRNEAFPYLGQGLRKKETENLNGFADNKRSSIYPFIRKNQLGQSKPESMIQSTINENGGSNNDSSKLIQPSDFESNILIASANGKLTSIIYLLANGTDVNTMDKEVS